jgi:hypothetical protein
MKKSCVLMILGLLLLPGLALAGEESATVAEVKKTIKENNAYTRENLESAPDVSQHGSVEFWSSGGLMNWISGDGDPQTWDNYNLRAKHIKVIPLVEGQVALAMYYSEGSMKPKGYPAVSHYLTRASEIYVKEDGEWKRRAAHWSAVSAGGGTTQSAE